MTPSSPSTAPAQPEVWLRGPVAGIAPELQPVAHALLQALEDAERLVDEITIDELWSTPGGAASIAFHLRHAAGSLDRLFTYARGEQLGDAQRTALVAESSPVPDVAARALVHGLRLTIERALAQLRDTAVSTLGDAREVGRARMPSTVRGLLFHAAEHTTRHLGQASTLVKVVRGMRSNARPATHPSG